MNLRGTIVPVLLALFGFAIPVSATSIPPVDVGTGDLTIEFRLGDSPMEPEPPPAGAPAAAGAAGSAGAAAGVGAERPRFTFEAQPHPSLGQVFFYLRSIDPLEGPFAVAIRDGEGFELRRLEGVMVRGSALVVWDGCATGGEKAGPGAYFAKLETGGEALSRNVIVR